jgi:hypothetical protein
MDFGFFASVTWISCVASAAPGPFSTWQLARNWRLFEPSVDLCTVGRDKSCNQVKAAEDHGSPNDAFYA